MLKRSIKNLITFVLLAACVSFDLAASEIKVVSANLRTVTASKKDGDNNWDHRKSAIAAMICKESPDIFGIQEGYLSQIDYLSENCPGYIRVGVGRNDGDKEGEHCSIYFKESRFTLLDKGDFWLSETPDSPSMGWDEKYYRITSWVKLRENESGKTVCVFNTHFPLSSEAKQGAMALMLERVNSISGNSATILIGDWNIKLDDPLFKPLLEQFTDLRTSFPDPDTQITYNGFGLREGKIIDHIFYRSLSNVGYRNLNGDYGVPYISDHYPVEGSFNLADDILRVLAIGNSYSVDAVNQNLHELATEAGKKLIIGNLYIGGCNLERHYKSLTEKKADYTYHKIGLDGVLKSTPNVEMTAGVFDEPWDIITLQQSSKTSGLIESYEPFLGELVRFLKDNVPGARLYWHQTWAYAVNSTHGSFSNYGRDQKTMYEGIMDCSSQVSRKYGFGLIPSGTAIQNLRSSYIGENVNRDGHHLGLITGRYTAALTWYATLFGMDPTLVSYAPDGILPFQAEAAREAARLAVSNPYQQSSMAGFKASADPNRNADVNWKDMESLRNNVYGTAPDWSDSQVRFVPVRQKKGLLDGKADAWEVNVFFKNDDKPYTKNGFNCFRMLILVPSKAKGKVPAILCMNDRGNHCLTDENWVHKPGKNELEAYKVYDNQDKGCDTSEWKVEKIIDSGCALVTYYFGDVTPDFDGGAARGIQRWFSKKYTWGALAAWAWSLSVAMDYLQSFNSIDSNKVTLMGDGKLGLAAEWAASQDNRFAKVKTGNTQDCGKYENHPHWYCRNFYEHSGGR